MCVDVEALLDVRMQLFAEDQTEVVTKPCPVLSALLPNQPTVNIIQL